MTYSVFFRPSQADHDIPADYAEALCEQVRKALSDRRHMAVLPDHRLAHTIDGVFTITSGKRITTIAVKFVLTISGSGYVNRPLVVSLISTVVDKFWKIIGPLPVLIEFDGPCAYHRTFEDAVRGFLVTRSFHYIPDDVRMMFSRPSKTAINFTVQVYGFRSIAFVLKWSKSEVTLSYTGTTEGKISLPLPDPADRPYVLLNVLNFIRSIAGYHYTTTTPLAQV